MLSFQLMHPVNSLLKIINEMEDNRIKGQWIDLLFSLHDEFMDFIERKMLAFGYLQAIAKRYLKRFLLFPL